MPVMHTAIPCTGSTADQAVSTVHVQLGATKHLTRPLTQDKIRQGLTGLANKMARASRFFFLPGGMGGG